MQGYSELRALLNAEIRFAEALHLLAEVGAGTLPQAVRAAFIAEPRLPNEFDAVFYQRLHSEDHLYQFNNWLVDAIFEIAKTKSDTILELGAGNGLFMRSIAGHARSVIAVDWAKSPGMADLPANCRFIQADITADDLPKADLVCSADVLEHIPFEKLKPTIRRWLNLAPLQHHIIACYDDGHSHLTVMPPGFWLYVFKCCDPSFRLLTIEVRRNDSRQVVCTISNLPEK